ncbi:unnamed protein product [Rotaria sp. Silwood2]|nr:unnamed protein product [Rotaria sp. Silwood2]
MTTNDHHLFYSEVKDLRIYLTTIRPTITWYFPLFKQIVYLTIQMPIIHSSLWNNLLNIINFRQTNDSNNNDDAEQCIIYPSHFVYLPNVIQIEFHSMVDVSRWRDIQFILQACPNMTNLIIGTRLLLLSKLIDNPSLISIFKQIKLIESKSKNIYFPSGFASKLVERFPSVIDIELQVYIICTQYDDYRRRNGQIR